MSSEEERFALLTFPLETTLFEHADRGTVEGHWIRCQAMESQMIKCIADDELEGVRAIPFAAIGYSGKAQSQLCRPVLPIDTV